MASGGIKHPWLVAGGLAAVGVAGATAAYLYMNADGGEDHPATSESPKKDAAAVPSTGGAESEASGDAAATPTPAEDTDTEGTSADAGDGDVGTASSDTGTATGGSDAASGASEDGASGAASESAASAGGDGEEEDLSMDDKLAMFMAWVGDVETEFARSWLESHGGDLQLAISSYMDVGLPGNTGGNVMGGNAMGAMGGGHAMTGSAAPVPEGGNWRMDGGGGAANADPLSPNASARIAQAIAARHGGGFMQRGPTYDDYGRFEPARPAAYRSHSPPIEDLTYAAYQQPMWSNMCTRTLFGDEAVPQPGYDVGVGDPRICLGCAVSCQSSSSQLKQDDDIDPDGFVCACADWPNEHGVPCMHRDLPPFPVDDAMRPHVLAELAASMPEPQALVQRLLAAVVNDNVEDVLDFEDGEPINDAFILSLHLHLQHAFAGPVSTDLASKLHGFGEFLRERTAGDPVANLAAAVVALEAALLVFEQRRERSPDRWAHTCLQLALALEARNDGADVLRAAELFMMSQQVFSPQNDEDAYALAAAGFARVEPLAAAFGGQGGA